jgi:hypothetical protein
VPARPRPRPTTVLQLTTTSLCSTEAPVWSHARSHSHDCIRCWSLVLLLLVFLIPTRYAARPRPGTAYNAGSNGILLAHYIKVVLARLEEETTDVAKWPQEYPSIDFSDEYVVRLLIKQTWQAVCKSKRKRARQLASSAEQQAETKVCPIVSVSWSRLTLCVSHPMQRKNNQRSARQRLSLNWSKAWNRYLSNADGVSVNLRLHAVDAFHTCYMPEISPHATEEDSVMHHALPWWSADLTFIFDKARAHMRNYEDARKIVVSNNNSLDQAFRHPPPNTPAWAIAEDYKES